MKMRVGRYERHYVGHADDAYDVLQDCFVAAWVGLQRYDAGLPFLPWLRTIALNKARDFGRRQAVRRMVMRVFSSEHAGEQTTETGDRAWEGRCRTRRAINAP